MYTAAYEKNKTATSDGIVAKEMNKVDRICEAVRQALISVDENK